MCPWYGPSTLGSLYTYYIPYMYQNSQSCVCVSAGVDYGLLGYFLGKRHFSFDSSLLDSLTSQKTSDPRSLNPSSINPKPPAASMELADVAVETRPISDETTFRVQGRV